jgi:hypothetical protein
MPPAAAGNRKEPATAGELVPEKNTWPLTENIVNFQPHGRALWQCERDHRPGIEGVRLVLG